MMLVNQGLKPVVTFKPARSCMPNALIPGAFTSGAHIAGALMMLYLPAHLSANHSVTARNL